jgi:hypothetical protein
MAGMADLLSLIYYSSTILVKLEHIYQDLSKILETLIEYAKAAVNTVI